jgi:hypothetical protein
VKRKKSKTIEKPKAKIKELRYEITIKAEPFNNAMECSHSIERLINKTKGLSCTGAGTYLGKPMIRDLSFISKIGYVPMPLKKQITQIRKQYSIKLTDFTMRIQE